MAIKRTISSQTENLHLVMLDISKALIEHLQKTIDPDELHIVKEIMEVTLAVRCGRSFSETFTTDTGVPQGD